MLPTSAWPYSDMHQLNLDWILRKLGEFENWVNSEATQDIKDFINEQFNNIFINAAYDSETETLNLYLDRRENNG